ncbi:exodeoxyribonuclease V subunit alpha [Aeromicrobium sp. 636]|uniref:RecBCD enzyme subunit RecD n=1 Tax=Aeromicrobium senzhongii TaxID=2663859 RepID=A0A8I0ETL8_9ACTN|nr:MULTISPECIES: exodeoxyribonuclease V subunit alpha [Aeromicrobium]MBC9225378.1 exodeoxyribonuclease V subunit alpha [Aeromicrobium senzhongii]MCQ3997488.1 exodeoxyribonuclease V subunit alpha [Aeromicrobium sp. 636]
MTTHARIDDFVAAEVLTPGDALVTARLGRITGESADLPLLALAFAVRAVRHGSTCFDPRHDPEVPGLTWPEPDAWLRAVEGSALGRVLVVEHGLLYLDRYRRLEVALCDDLTARATLSAPPLDEDRLTEDLDRLFPDAEHADQRAAAERAARVGTIVLTGGPGTGKTTTVAGVLAILQAQSLAMHGRSLRVALTAPTGKAAARMREAVAATASRLALTDDERTWLTALPSSTMHRLLGWRPDNHTRFRHDRLRRLPHDVVVVDETSMASLEHVARLLEALRPDTRLILVGDADQLASVEAGAVLHDVVAGWSDEHVVRLTRSHRFGAGIGRLAAAVRDGDADTAVELLTAGDPAIRLVQPDQGVSLVESTLLPIARDLVAAGRRDDADTALRRLGEHRLLCAHRDGPYGAATWNERVTSGLRHDVGYGDWYPGRPVLVTRNDAGLGVFNGDAGVVVEREGQLVVAVDGEPVREFATSRLPDVQTGYAMTIHRSQGSEFAQVTVLLPDADSRAMTRELLYTAITRAVDAVTVIGTTDDIRTAIGRRVARSSGIAERLAARQPAAR